MSTLFIAIDPGGSLTKVVLSLEGQHHYFLMSPEIAKLPRSIVEAKLHQTIGLELYPQETAWVQTLDDEEDCYVIGSLAQQFLGINTIQKLKYESGVYKALAAIGCAMQQHPIDEKNLQLVISFALPYGEFHNRYQLEEKIRKTVKNFIFRGRRYRLKVQEFQCRPEGSGLFFWQVRQKGVPWIGSNSVDILMLGHRNVSYLRFSRGQMQQGATGDLGIYQLIKRVMDKAPGQNEARLLPILCSDRELTPQAGVVQDALQSESPENRMNEAKMLIQAVESTYIEYWRSLDQWLGTIDRNRYQPTEILISGGGAYLPYIRKNLINRFQRTSINWCQELHQTISEVFESKQMIIPVRLADPYALLNALEIGQRNKLKEAAR